MDPSSSGGRGHSRNKSVTKASRPRSSTKGPLDLVDDPLATARGQPVPRALLSPSAPRLSTGQRSPIPRSPLHSPGPPLVRASLPKDFGFLLRPEIYHPLTPLNVPLPFRNSPNQPSPDAPIPELLAKGHFRAAAIAAVHELTGSGGVVGGEDCPPVDPLDHARIFRLLHVRLACLTLVDATALAAQEVKALEDLNNAALYVDDATGEHLVPWELRVLNVRLQALGFGDPRRSVMAYHDLAREARERLARAVARRDNSARELWRVRLHELGVKVAGALVEMDDLPGAAHHLATMRDKGTGAVAMSKALLWLHLGDADAARRCFGVGDEARSGEGYGKRVIEALCDMADGEYEAALQTWKVLGSELDDEMVGVNTAVCLLYLGRMDEGREVLEKLVDSGFSSHTLLFNLATMYELCTERNRNLKLGLAEKVAKMEPTPQGWEKINADFKL